VREVSGGALVFDGGLWYVVEKIDPAYSGIQNLYLEAYTIKGLASEIAEPTPFCFIP